MRLFQIFLIFIIFFYSFACNVDNLEIKYTSPPRGWPDDSRYNLTEMEDQFPKEDLAVYSHHISTSLSCVEAVSQRPIFGTPGGDFGEFILGVSTYAKHTKQIPSEDKVLEIFTKYVQEIASPGRPFYYHNSKTNLDALFETIPVEPKPSIVPFEEPKEASFWYKQWILPEFQGCTLVSDMLKNATNFGIPHKSIVENSLIAFLKTWWRLPMEDKAKINFEVSLGDYEEKAISIIINEGPSCHDHSPMAYTNTRASSVFVYHPMVINDFRRQKLLPFFKRYDNAIDSTKIQIEVRDHAEEIYERFMSAVSPNANVNTFTLRIITSGEVEKSKISSLRVTTMISMILLVLLFLIAVMVGSGIGSFYLGRKYQRNIVETQGTKMKEDEKDQQPPVVLEEQKNDESFK